MTESVGRTPSLTLVTFCLAQGLLPGQIPQDMRGEQRTKEQTQGIRELKFTTHTEGHFRDDAVSGKPVTAEITEEQLGGICCQLVVVSC